MKPVLIVSCEHFSKQIPAEYSHLFIKKQKLLDSHQGWDKGTAACCKALSNKKLAAFHQFGQWSRLLVDLNRSLKKKCLFSSVTQPLSEDEKKLILKKYYYPYRNSIEKRIDYYYAKKIPVVHLSLHSFVPKLNGQLRNNDVGLLYDPSHSYEKNFCMAFKSILSSLNKDLKIRFNYPYRGSSDGFTTFLRKKIPNKYYCGIEIEINQKHFDAEGNCRTSLVKDIVTTIEKLKRYSYVIKNV